MSNHTCKYAVVTCIDFRFQEALEAWINEHCGPGNYDRIALAGGVKSWDAIMDQLRVSKRLHMVETVILINHEDCGAYGAEGTFTRHQQDLQAAAKEVAAKLGLKAELCYAKLDGTIVPVAA